HRAWNCAISRAGNLPSCATASAPDRSCGAAWSSPSHFDMAGRADARSSQHPRCVVSGGTERSYCMPCRESDQYDEDLTHAILDGEDQGIIRHPPAMGCQPHMADPVKEQCGADPDER